MEEEENIGTILFMHKNTGPKHGGSVAMILSEEEELMHTTT
jgi:hypothetical protein